MDKDIIVLTTAIVGAVCGGAGAILGVINTWHNLSRRRVRLRVTPHHVVPVDMGRDTVNVASAAARPPLLPAHGPIQDAASFGITVLNLSEFPVFIDDIGFCRKGKCLSSVRMIADPSELPVLLEPRTAYMASFDIARIGNGMAGVTSAYALTRCGVVAKGTSPALKQWTRSRRGYGR